MRDGRAGGVEGHDLDSGGSPTAAVLTVNSGRTNSGRAAGQQDQPRQGLTGRAAGQQGIRCRASGAGPQLGSRANSGRDNSGRQQGIRANSRQSEWSVVCMAE